MPLLLPDRIAYCYMLAKAVQFRRRSPPITMNSCAAAAARRIGTLYLSSSRSIYENLAFEEWVFRNHDLAHKGEAVLMWRLVAHSQSAPIGFCLVTLQRLL